MTPEQDIVFLRRAFDVARRARDAGDHPFGSLLIGPDGAVLREQGNGYSAEGGDRTAHSERLLASWAAKAFELDYLRRCTPLHFRRAVRDVRGRDLLGGVGRVVYGQSEKGLKAATGAHAENPTLDLPCRTVFAAGQRATEVVGPLLEDDAAQLQADYWASRK